MLTLASCSKKESDISVESSCSTTLYGLKNRSFGDLPELISFNEDKPTIPNILIEALGTKVSTTYPKNFAAYDTTSHSYTYSYLLQPNDLSYITTMSSNDFSSAVFPYLPKWAAPVYSGNKLFAIQITHNSLTDLKSGTIKIFELNQEKRGTELASSTFGFTGPFSNETVSSTKDNKGNIYFLSGTTLVKYNISSYTVSYVSLEAQDKPTFYGLHYQVSEDRLLALRTAENQAIDLVTLNTNMSSGYLTLFDIKSQLPSNNSGIATSNYSTAFSQCSSTYYIAELASDEFKSTGYYTNLISIDINKGEMEHQTLDGYFYGLVSNDH